MPPPNPATPATTAQPSRRQLVALALVLAATLLTGGVAIAGLTQTPSPAPAAPTAGQVQTIPPAATEPVEPGG